MDPRDPTKVGYKDCNPLRCTEFYKYDYNFQWMKYENAIYSTEHYFP